MARETSAVWRRHFAPVPQANAHSHVNIRSAVIVQACSRHETAPTASAALGRLLMGTLLLAAFREEQATTQVSVWLIYSRSSLSMKSRQHAR